MTDIVPPFPRIDQPQAGFFRTRLVKGGPYVGARIWLEPPIDPLTGEAMDRPPMMLAELAGKPIDPIELWPSVAGRNIPEQEYRYLIGVAGWAAEHAPNAPEATPREPINLNRLPSLF